MFDFVRIFGRPVSLSFNTPSLCRQEFRHDADMNVIVNKFLATGCVPQPNLGRPLVDGLEAPGDFTAACEEHFTQQVMQLHDPRLDDAKEGEDIKDGDNQQSASADSEAEKKE